jgi:hypothetical protein
MKNQKPVFIAIAFALAFALAPIVQAVRPDGGPGPGAVNDRPVPQPLPPANDRVSDSPEGENLPAISIHSAGNILRGKTGTFILEMKPALMFGGTYVNFSVSGTAVAGVDYTPFLSPAYIGQSGYAVISFATLPDPRAGASRQAYSVTVTLEPSLGYALGAQKSATIWIKSAQ